MLEGSRSAGARMGRGLRRLLLLTGVIIESLVKFELLHVFSVLDRHIFRDLRLARKERRLLTGIGGLELLLFLCSVDHTLNIDKGSVSLLTGIKSVAGSCSHLNVDVVGAWRVV